MATDRSRPFCREEDDARREEQRRWLRTVDSQVVERAIVGYFKGLPEIPDHVDRLLVEDALRQFANKHRKEHKKVWRDKYTFGERARAMQAALTLLSENWDPSTGTAFQLGNLQQEADDTMNEFYGLADPPDEEFFALVRTVSAVVYWPMSWRRTAIAILALYRAGVPESSKGFATRIDAPYRWRGILGPRFPSL